MIDIHAEVEHGLQVLLHAACIDFEAAVTNGNHKAIVAAQNDLNALAIELARYMRKRPDDMPLPPSPAECAALRRDARRYAFLRNVDRASELRVVEVDADRWGDALDELVDTAIAKESDETD